MQARLVNSVALMAAVLSVQAAQAAVNGPSASSVIYWPSFQVQITDLDLGDGIVPSFTFANQAGYVEAYAQSPVDNQWVYDPLGASNWTTWLTSSASTTHAEASATANTAIHLASATAEQSVGMCGGVPCTGLNQVNRGAAYTLRTADFTLTGAAEAVIHLDWSIAVTDATPLDSLDYAFASTFVGWDYELSDLSGPDNIHHNYQPLDTRIHLVSNLSGTDTLTITNPTNLTTAAGYLRLETYSNAEGYINPVPEPETWAMLLAGLGLVGAIARRRARR